MNVEIRDARQRSEYETIGSIKESILKADYALSQWINQNSYVLLMRKLLELESHMKNLIVVSLEGEKEFFYKIKDIIDKNMDSFFSEHEELVEQRFKLKKEAQKNTH